MRLSSCVMLAKKNDLPLPRVPRMEKKLVWVSSTQRGISKWHKGHAIFLHSIPFGSMAKPSMVKRLGRNRIMASSTGSLRSPTKDWWLAIQSTSSGKNRFKQFGQVAFCFSLILRELMLICFAWAGSMIYVIILVILIFEITFSKYQFPFKPPIFIWFCWIFQPAGWLW